jgi:hypothetical protein
MSNSINFNNNNGKIAIGSISQGNNTSVTSSANLNSFDSSKDKAISAIERSAEEYGFTPAETNEIKQQLNKLAEELRKSNAKESTTTLKVIRNNFPLIYPLVKDFVTEVWPEIISALGN